MRFKTIAPLAALALGASMTFSAPVAAQVARGAPAIAATDDGLLQNVQYRRYYGGGPYRPYPYRPYYRERRSDAGAAVAAGIIGLAAGAIIAGAASAPPPAVRDQAWIDYCFSKYRSFDPASGTYLGYDGLRHYCQ
jgi:hypothetical protein